MNHLVGNANCDTGSGSDSAGEFYQKAERIGEKKNRKSAADLKSFSNRQHLFILLEVLPQ